MGMYDDVEKKEEKRELAAQMDESLKERGEKGNWGSRLQQQQRDEKKRKKLKKLNPKEVKAPRRKKRKTSGKIYFSLFSKGGKGFFFPFKQSKPSMLYRSSCLDG